MYTGCEHKNDFERVFPRRFDVWAQLASLFGINAIHSSFRLCFPDSPIMLPLAKRGIVERVRKSVLSTSRHLRFVNFEVHFRDKFWL